MHLKKEDILKACKEQLIQKQSLLQLAIKDIEESMLNETKSSLGDKHETSRAKMQTEQEKLSNQMKELNNQTQMLDKIDIGQEYNKVNFGCIVVTNRGTFFIALPLGKIEINHQELWLISAFSPIAKAMMGLKIKNQFEFNQMNYTIQVIY